MTSYFYALVLEFLQSNMVALILQGKAEEQ